MAYRIIDRIATPIEHELLARSVGWEGHFDDEVRAASLRGSLAGVVCVGDDGSPIGMARAVGDGLQYAYVQDVIVAPECAGRGIATDLVARLLELLRPTGDVELFVGLFASDDAVGVYESLGFAQDGASGMHQVLVAERR